MAKKSNERIIDGVKCIVKEGKYYFAKQDLFRRFGYTDRTLFNSLCPGTENKIKFSDGEPGVPFEDLIALASHSKKDLPNFVNALQKEVDQNKAQITKSVKTNNHPDFFNDPAGSARSWAEQFERIAVLEKELKHAKELLGDGDDFKMARAIPWIPQYFNTARMYLYTAIGNRLWRMSQHLDAPIKKCAAFGYCESNTRNMYSVKIIDLLKQSLDSDEEFMKNYRLKKHAEPAKISRVANG